jgi:hypothetical protein
VLPFYREKYFDFNVRHVPRELTEEHGLRISYTWVKMALPGAGLVAKQRRRGTHRPRRPRRPLPGMLLHIDACKHAWFGDGRYYDLITVLDDATSEIYYAQLVEEEGTRTRMPAMQEGIQRQGLFCALYRDRASHFFVTPQAGGKVDATQVTQLGRALPELGPQDSGLLASGPRDEGSGATALGKDGCHRSCGCARSPLWRRRTSFLARSIGPNATVGSRWRPRVKVLRLCARSAKI